MRKITWLKWRRVLLTALLPSKWRLQASVWKLCWVLLMCLCLFCFFSFLFFPSVINAIVDPTGNLDIVASNKASSAAKQSTATKVRTANNSGSTLETLSPAQMRNYAQKSNCGSSSLQDSNFIPDGEKYVIWYSILYCCYTVIYCRISIVYEWFVDSLCGAVV